MCLCVCVCVCVTIDLGTIAVQHVYIGYAIGKSAGRQRRSESNRMQRWCLCVDQAGLIRKPESRKIGTLLHSGPQSRKNYCQMSGNVAVIGETRFPDIFPAPDRSRVLGFF